MINKFSLSFLSDSIEFEYRKQQQVQLKQEFSLFCFQTIVFFSAYILYYFDKYTFNMAVVINILVFVVVVVILKCIIKANPSLSEYILPLLQIYFAYIWNLDSFFPDYYPAYDEGTAVISYNYDWYYGFQAFYFHSAILQLGYQIWPQAIVLICIYFDYILYYPSYSLEYYSMCSTIFLVFIGLIVMKYSNEKLRRQQFIDNREKVMWIKIIDEVLDCQIVVVKFDNKQDQLVLQQINEFSKLSLKILNNKDLREYLRNVSYQLLQMIIIKEKNNQNVKQKTLEDEIRHQILKEQNNFQQIEIDVKQQQEQTNYKVKLISQVIQEEQCVIVIFQKNQQNEIKDLSNYVYHRDVLFKFLFTTFMSYMKNAKTKAQFMFPLVNFQLYKSFILNQKFSCNSWMDINLIKSQFQETLGIKIEFINKQNLTGIVTNKYYFLNVIMSLGFLYSQLKRVKVKRKYFLHANRLAVTLTGTMTDIIANIKLLQKNLKFSNCEQKNQMQILRILSNILESSNFDPLRKSQIVSIYLNKVLIWNIFKENTFKVKFKDSNTYLTFEISLTQFLNKSENK